MTTSGTSMPWEPCNGIEGVLAEAGGSLFGANLAEGSLACVFGGVELTRGARSAEKAHWRCTCWLRGRARERVCSKHIGCRPSWHVLTWLPLAIVDHVGIPPHHTRPTDAPTARLCQPVATWSRTSICIRRTRSTSLPFHSATRFILLVPPFLYSADPYRC